MAEHDDEPLEESFEEHPESMPAPVRYENCRSPCLTVCFVTKSVYFSHPAERKKGRSKVYNQRSDRHVDLVDAVMQPRLGNHAKTVSKPEAKDLRRHDQYVLNHQDNPLEHHVYKVIYSCSF